MKRKILSIKSDMEIIISQVCIENFRIDWYGAYDIDPKHLVFWICVQTDDMKLLLKSDTGLVASLKHTLVERDYPIAARDLIHIDFESQETVDRESDGDWYTHFK